MIRFRNGICLNWKRLNSAIRGRALNVIKRVNIDVILMLSRFQSDVTGT